LPTCGKTGLVMFFDENQERRYVPGFSHSSRGNHCLGQGRWTRAEP
jgi:hypothetical protein